MTLQILLLTEAAENLLSDLIGIISFEQHRSSTLSRVLFKKEI